MHYPARRNLSKVKNSPGSSGCVEKTKVRLVPGRIQEAFGFDYAETYALVLSFTSGRSLLAIVAHLDS